jgi:hypothetical protein
MPSAGYNFLIHHRTHYAYELPKCGWPGLVRKYVLAKIEKSIAGGFILLTINVLAPRRSSAQINGMLFWLRSFQDKTVWRCLKREQAIGEKISTNGKNQQLPELPIHFGTPEKIIEEKLF